MSDEVKLFPYPEKKSEKKDNKESENDTQEIIKILKLIDRCCGDKCKIEK